MITGNAFMSTICDVQTMPTAAYYAWRHLVHCRWGGPYQLNAFLRSRSPPAVSLPHEPRITLFNHNREMRSKGRVGRLANVRITCGGVLKYTRPTICAKPASPQKTFLKDTVGTCTVFVCFIPMHNAHSEHERTAAALR